MRMLEVFATAFIRVFGITEPKPAQLRAASWFILAMLIGVVMLVTTVGLTLHHVLSR